MLLPHILRLPVELHLSILDKLEIYDVVNLATTNRYFRAIVKPPLHEDYLTAETDDQARHRRLYACSGCSHFRRFEEFADHMKKGKYTRGGVLANARLCLKCGVVRGVYAPDMPVVIYGKTHVLCRMCGTFTDHITRQSCCNRCSPGSCSSSPTFEKSVHLQYQRRSKTLRSARVYFDNSPMDDFPENWRDV